MRFRTVLLSCVFALAISAWGQQSPTAHVPTNGTVPVHTMPGTMAPATSANTLSPEMSQAVENYVRETFAFGKAFQIQFGPAKDAPITGFYEVPLQVNFQGHAQTAIFYVSKDGKLLIQGTVSRISADPFDTGGGCGDDGARHSLPGHVARCPGAAKPYCSALGTRRNGAQMRLTET